MTSVAQLSNDELLDVYSDLVQRREGLCGLQKFLFTWAVVVGIAHDGDYSHRYCFEREEDARAALEAWGDEEHPGGPWIKRKGGDGGDMLNPNFGVEPDPRTARPRGR